MMQHHDETFSAILALCAENSQVIREFPSQRPVTRSFDVSFDQRLNKRLSKQWKPRRFETPSCLLWSHSNDCKLSVDAPNSDTNHDIAPPVLYQPLRQNRGLADSENSGRHYADIPFKSVWIKSYRNVFTRARLMIIQDSQRVDNNAELSYIFFDVSQNMKFHTHSSCK